MSTEQLIDLVNDAFETLYKILDQECADPDETCFAVTSVHTDIVNILTGKLTIQTDEVIG